MSKLRVAIYARVSKAEDGAQDPENQLRQLRDWCAAAGHTIVHEYVERGSGTKGTDSRQQLKALLNSAHRREFDLVLFWALDRFSREGMVKTVGYLERLTKSGVAFHSYTEEWLATDNELVSGILLAAIAGLAKQEAIKISERTKAGLDRARAAGKQLGRRSLDPSIEDAIIAAKKKDASLSQRALGRKFSVSAQTVAKVLRGANMIK